MQSESDLPAFASQGEAAPAALGPSGCNHTRAQRSKLKREGAHQVTSPRAEEKYSQRNILVSILETSERVYLLYIRKLP